MTTIQANQPLCTTQARHSVAHESIRVKFEHDRGKYWSVRLHTLKMVDPSSVARNAVAFAEPRDDITAMVGLKTD